MTLFIVLASIAGYVVVGLYVGRSAYLSEIEHGDHETGVGDFDMRIPAAIVGTLLWPLSLVVWGVGSGLVRFFNAPIEAQKRAETKARESYDSLWAIANDPNQDPIIRGAARDLVILAREA